MCTGWLASQASHLEGEGRSIGTPGRCRGPVTSVWTWMRIGDPLGSATG